MALARSSNVTQEGAPTLGDSKLIDLEQAAFYLGTSERHLRRLWQERRIAGIKVGRRVHFSRRDLDVFIEKNRCEAAR